MPADEVEHRLRRLIEEVTRVTARRRKETEGYRNGIQMRKGKILKMLNDREKARKHVLAVLLLFMRSFLRTCIFNFFDIIIIGYCVLCFPIATAVEIGFLTSLICTGRALVLFSCDFM